MWRENLEEERLVLTDEELQLEVKKLGRYIDPLSDWGFKKIFGSELSEELLIELLNVIIDDEDNRIVSLEYSKNEYKSLVKNSRNAIFDVSCRTGKGERFIIEIQKHSQEFFTDRLLYYSTFPIQEQGKIGDWNFELCPVIMVGILNFEYNNIENDRFIYKYDVKEHINESILTKNLRFILVELAKFDKEIDERSSKRDKWLYVLKNLSRLLDKPEALQDRVFEKLFQIAEVAAMERDEQLNYIKVMTTENDIRNQLAYAKKMAIKEGLAEGKAEVALSLKQNGVAIEIIATCTGLSIEDIQNM